MSSIPTTRASRDLPGIDSSTTRRAAPGTTTALWALLVLLPLAAYWSTAVSIAAIWTRSETFAHGYLIVPISLWLVWRRRDWLRAMTPTPYWPALLPLAACGGVWLLAELGEVQVARQYAFVAMFPLTALAVMGPRMTGELAFPLLFLLLAVPVGDSLIEPLMTITATSTVAALRLSGLPVLHEGNNFMLPSGSWSVVEACSGLRYLVASVTVGVLYAYLTYSVLWKRVLFVIAATLLPVLANVLRAYMIVMLGHMSDMKVAVGVDHLLYGWLFFGIVIFTLLLIGARWRDPSLPIATQAPASLSAPAGHIGAMALAVALVLGIWPTYAGYLHSSTSFTMPTGLNSFRAKAPFTAAFTNWQPSFGAPAATLRHYYMQQDRQVGLSLLYYRGQHSASKLITSTNRLTPMINSPWTLSGGNLRYETVAGRNLVLRESKLGSVQSTLLVWSWYWIDGRTTTSDTVGKLLQIRQSVFTGSDDGVAVMLFAPGDEHPDAARAAMHAFLTDNLSALDATLEQVRRQRGTQP